MLGPLAHAGMFQHMCQSVSLMNRIINAQSSVTQRVLPFEHVIPISFLSVCLFLFTRTFNRCLLLRLSKCLYVNSHIYLNQFTHILVTYQLFMNFFLRIEYSTFLWYFINVTSNNTWHTNHVTFLKIKLFPLNHLHIFKYSENKF